MADTTVVVTEGRRNPLPIVLGVALGALALFLLWMFVISPLLEDEVAAPADPAAPVEPLPPTESGPLPTETATGVPPIETYEVYLARDPFRPLVLPGAGGTDGETPPPDGTPVPLPTPTDSNGNPLPTPTDSNGNPLPTGNGTASPGDDSQTIDGREVVVIDVFVEGGQPRAVISVDDRAYEVGEGDTFDDNFRVLSIDPPCVTLLFGDDEFTLCEGERVLK